ncbi:MAG: hypothetical protein HY049_18670 [Acidobacteria bacterium]|nr:hypothetical protein [Acidobacteriota bacterium]
MPHFERKLIASLLCLVLGAFLAPGPVVAAAPASLEAKALFERLKSLEGTWVGRSTKGWEDQTSFRTIADGSVVVETSFDAHPGETMLTTYHLDGPRVMLTHYCVAKNQPRMVAHEIGDGGSSAVFTFIDGTGMASRDAGHMDRAAFSFQDRDHFTSKWSWYQDGKEQWMEEIRYERK